MSEVPGAQVAPRVRAVIPAVPESPVFPAPEVLLVAPEMPVPKEKSDLPERPERTAGPDPLGPWELADSPASWDSLDPKEPGVSLVREGRRDFWERLD